MTNYIIAMTLGVLGTAAFHLAKGMQKQGIESYGLLWSWMKKDISTGELKEHMTKPVIYAFGLLLNATLPLMILFSGRFAPASYFTSMFGLGLIVLMLYSARVLKEPVTRQEFLGALVLIAGTVFLGVENIYRTGLDMSRINTNRVWIFVGIYMVLSLSFLIAMLKKGTPFVIGISFGLFTGFTACLDPIFKAMGQNLGGKAGYIPATTEGWIVFLFSFLFGTASFSMTQWGFAMQARASVLVPVHNSLVVMLPVIIQAIALPGFTITWITVAGLFLTTTGILSMHAVFNSESSE